LSDQFVHLHAHCEYSLLDGLGRLGDLVDAAAGMQMPALALTDHGTMFGAVEFYSKAKQVGIKPIIGCEVYVADRPLDERAGSDAKNYHLVLLAENEAGYRNLIRLTTEAHLRGFYRRPRVDHALLEAHSEGLICLSGCASGELASSLLSDNLSEAENLADWYHQVFGDRYYLELQYHDLDFQPKINQGVVHLSRKLGLPLVASNDVHYVQARHARAHEILLCIQTQTTMDDPKRMKLGTGEFYLKSAEQMTSLFGHHPGAITNTLAIAERCNLDLSFGRPQLPVVDVPSGRTSEAHLRALCEEGLRTRYDCVTEEIRERLNYELSVIERTGFVDYFLLVYDVIHFARQSGIGVGPGRGSSAGSLVAYLLFVTNVDPIAHELSFERFLNPERVSMPDMDLDFADDRRDEVIRYVTEKFGRERVAQIITFGTIGPRAGVRDVGRALGMSYDDVDRVAKLIPPMCSKLAKAKQDVAELRQLYEADPDIRTLLDAVEDVEGVARHASTHAAGVVIARDPLANHVPLYKVPKNDQVVTQYAMGSIEKIGLLKMDFLGLRTLSILQRACSFVESAAGKPMVLDDIPLDDPSIYQLLASGQTFAIFQVDGDGMRRLLIDLQPAEFAHIVAVVALYRPGPMGQIPDFVERRHGRNVVSYIHPALREVLEPTYGILVYQEQVMKLFSLVAGYSLGEADLVRRAMAKKKPEELAKHHASFLDRAEERGTSREIAQQMWDIVEPFCGYAFPKPHATAYAVLTCQTAYLKANYPREYLAGYLSAEREDAEKVASAVAECRRLGIPVLPPDVNASAIDFTLEGSGIRFGLAAIKHAGEGAVEAVVRCREEGGPFSSLEDFCARVDWRVVNKRVVESLAKCGALDSLGTERGKLLANLDRIAAFGAQLQRQALSGQTSLFGEVEQPGALMQLAIADSASLEDKLAWEQELLGFFVSPHPLNEAGAQFATAGAVAATAVSNEHNGLQLRVGGMIQRLRTFSTRDGRPMASFQLTGLDGSLESVVFSRSYEQLGDKLTDNAIVVAEGKVDASDGKVRLLINGIMSTDEAAARPASNARRREASGSKSEPKPAAAGSSAPTRRVRIELIRSADRAADLQRVESLYGALLKHPGIDEVEICVRGPKTRSIPLPDRHVAYSPALEAELSAIVGDAGSVVVESLQASA
jgi:DNA polymerase-3 subunit alpha